MYIHWRGCVEFSCENRSRDEMKLVESSLAGWRMESDDFSARVLSNEKWMLRISPTVT